MSLFSFLHYYPAGVGGDQGTGDGDGGRGGGEAEGNAVLFRQAVSLRSSTGR